jgi:hypothetical protein
MLLSGQVLGQHALGSGSQCFVSHLSEKASFEACCGRATTGTTGTGDVEGTTFDYACNTYVSPLVEFKNGSFRNAYSCGKQCADSPDCAVAVWGSDNLKCFYATSARPERATVATSFYVTIENKRPTNLQPQEPGDCEKLVDEAATDCKNAERKKCDERIENQALGLREDCDRRGAEACDKQKEQMRKQFEEDQAAKDNQHRRNLQKLQDEIDRLRSQNKDRDPGQKSGGNDGSDDGTKEPKDQPPGSSPSSKSRIPTEQEFKCPDFDGKEYTVLGVRYKVFCNLQPKGNSMAGGRLQSKDPEFLMAMCSVDRNCQGIKTQSNSAEMVLEHDYPPAEKSPYSGWWSIVPINKKSDLSAMVPDLFSQPSNGANTPGADRRARCPSLDGNTLDVGGNGFQVNCMRNYYPKRTYSVPSARSFRQCLVACTVDGKCEGVMYSYECLFILEHEVLEKNTPKNRWSTDTYVAMLTVPRDSNQGKKS